MTGSTARGTVRRVEGSPENGEQRARRTGVVLGVLATLVLALGIVLGVVIASDDDGGSDEPDVTAATSSTRATQPTVTVTEPPARTTTATAPSEPTITQVQAKAAAARAATEEAAKGGVSIPPSDWDARCTALAGRPDASSWTCQVASSSGQCSGTIGVYARTPGDAATRDPRIGCGE
jgi:hypothetical protein